MVINYKSTLNLPVTKFSMRGDLINSEPERLKIWHNNNLYRMLRSKKDGKNMFFIHDGPPYANGNIHIGHAVNKILKDIIIKFKGLDGCNVPYIPGWDCHGLPIELKVEELLRKLNNNGVDGKEFRIMCRDYAKMQIDHQRKDFIRLGVLGGWDDFYCTMDFITEANIIRCFSQVISKGYVYRGMKPAYWCFKCSSVLSESEIEYDHDHISPSIYVAFFSSDSASVAIKFGIQNFKCPISLVIWNTTPWTLPGNRALAVHPDYDYCLVKIDGEYYIFAVLLLDHVLNCMNCSDYKIFGLVKGRDLEYLYFKHPLMSYDVPVVLADYVLSTIGTGVVHIAPGHGVDDYVIARKYNLEVSNVVDGVGCYHSGILSYLDNVNILQANGMVIDLLKRNRGLLYCDQIQHSYPYCWRHKIPVVFRTTFQWFINLEHCNLRQLCLNKIDDMNWIPSTGKSHIQSMILDRPDWCISRQRTWGVPMTLFFKKEDNSLHPRTIDIMEIVAKKVEKFGVQAWWDLDSYEMIGDDVTQYNKVYDVLDVWFDSSATYYAAVASVRPEFKSYIPDMYLEGSDQYRGWFMSSLLLSVIMTGQVPCRTVVVHGFSVDCQGKKMSKSVGNVISPQQVIDQFGADVLRLWVASNDYTTDMVFSDDSIQHASIAYRKIRNTVRFILGNLNDFDPKKHIVSSRNMVAVDCWLVNRILSVQLEIISDYKNYNFHKVVQKIMYFCSIELSSFYLDIIKDRQYVTQTNSILRRSSQSVLYYVLEFMVRWITPIIPFTADEIWQYIPGERSAYVFFEEWYSKLFDVNLFQVIDENDWNMFFQVRTEVNKVIEKKRATGYIGSSLESSVILYATPKLTALLRRFDNELHFGFLTSSVVVRDYNYFCETGSSEQGSVQGLRVLLEKAKGRKCYRCWHYTVDVGMNTSYPDMCNRCIVNVFGSGERRRFF